MLQYKFAEYDVEQLKKARKAVEFFDNGDPMRDVLDKEDIEDIICLFVAIMDEEQKAWGDDAFQILP